MEKSAAARDKAIHEVVRSLGGTLLSMELPAEKLLAAASSGQAEMCASLLKSGVKVSRGPKIANAFHFAASGAGPLEGRTDVCRLLLEHEPDAANDTSSDGHRPLYLAAGAGALPIVELLAPVTSRRITRMNLRFDLFMENLTDLVRVEGDPLWIAAQNGHSDVCQVLIDEAFPVHWDDGTFMSPLRVAVASRPASDIPPGCHRAARILIAAGAPIDDIGSLYTATYFPKIIVSVRDAAFRRRMHALIAWSARRPKKDIILPVLAKLCSSCRKPNAKLVCTRCKKARYCSAACQRADWSEHKPDC